MDVDTCCDDAEPEEYWNYLSDDDIKDIVFVAKIVSVPTLAFVAIAVFNYWLDKKIGSL
jgi:hypothetical protein